MTRYVLMRQRWLTILGCLVSGTCTTVQAEETPVADDSESVTGSRIMEVISVSATKTGAVNVQEVPVSVTVFDETQLFDAGINNIGNLSSVTPGLSITRNGQATRLYLRGIGTNLDFIGSDPSVTVHQDGIYQARTSTVLNEFLGVDRVEVLRGPQGTLYGRNSTGGTINVISKVPQAEPEVSVGMALGNFAQQRIFAEAGGALGSESVMGNIALLKTRHDAYVDVVGDSAEDGLADDDSSGAKGALRFLLGNSGELIWRADYGDTDKASGAYKPTGLTTTGETAPLAGALDLPSDPWTMNISYDNPFVKVTQWGTSAEWNWEGPGGWSVTSLTGYRDLDFHTIEDTDGSNLAILFTEVGETQNQLSQELRLNFQSDRLRWVFGLYYLAEAHDTDTSVHVEGPGLRNGFVASNDTTAVAAFTEATWSLASQWNATLGVRYSQEEKSFSNVNQLVSEASGAQLSGFEVDETVDWDSWSPKVALDYTISPGKMLYLGISRGFKSGGFNMTSGDARFNPEYVWAYEAGAKLDWLPGQVRSNLAVFYYNYTDLQVSDFTQPGVLSISNAADAIIQGVEIENQWTPNEHWRFDLNYAYLNAEYNQYLAPNGDAVVDVSGNRLNAAPEHKLSLAAQYFQSIDAGTLSYRLEWFWQDKSYFTAFNEAVSSQGAYGLVNARVSFLSADERWEVQAYGENLGDKAYSLSSREFPAATVGVTKDINPPRTFGARLVYHVI